MRKIYGAEITADIPFLSLNDPLSFAFAVLQCTQSEQGKIMSNVGQYKRKQERKYDIYPEYIHFSLFKHTSLNVDKVESSIFVSP